MPSTYGRWVLEGDEAALHRVYMPHDLVALSSGTLPTWLRRARREVTEYFLGERTIFTITLADVAATAFQRDVWEAIATVPYGEVATYGEIAQMVGRPLASRAVGNANHHNPWPIVVPCHRIVASNHLGGYGGGADLKRWLLSIEGVHDYDPPA